MLSNWIPPMRRDTNIDAFRVLLVFFVCIMHSIYVGAQRGVGCAWLSNLVEWSVPGFIVISGWYGINFSFAKVIKLYAVSLYCAIVVVSLDTWLRGGELGLCTIRTIWRTAIGYWFVNSYVVLMMLAPLVNTAFTAIRELDSLKKKKVLITICLPIFVLVEVWAFSATLPGLGLIVPHYSGIAKSSFGTLLALYVLTRAVRLALQDEKMSKALRRVPCWLWLIAVILATVMASLGMGDINGPFAFIIALTMFAIFNRLRLPILIGKTFGLLAPSVFSIYLFHTNEIAWSYMRTLLMHIINACDNRFIAYVIVAFVALMLGLVLDIPRRAVKFLMVIRSRSNLSE